jgi:3-oxoacyl-[acyl-carrier protein] reductase
MTDLTGEVAIVTGASKGIGAAIAKDLAKAGAAVVVNYASSKEGADKVIAAITDSGGKAVAVQGDVSVQSDVSRLFGTAVSTFGSVDILVNNAGVYSFQSVEDITVEEFQRQYNTNVLGPILATQQAVKCFSASGGSIINISSVASRSPHPGAALYASTKGALDTLTKALAKELGPKNIRVNTIAPGATDTEGARGLGLTEGDFAKSVIEKTPMGRFGQPEDIAPAVTFLASDAAKWVTGELINVSGGLS